MSKFQGLFVTNSKLVPFFHTRIVASTQKSLKRCMEHCLYPDRAGLPRPRTTGPWPGGDRPAVSSKFTPCGPRQALLLPFLRNSGWLQLCVWRSVHPSSRAARVGTSPTCPGEALSIGASFCAVLQVTVGLFSLFRARCLGSYSNLCKQEYTRCSCTI